MIILSVAEAEKRLIPGTKGIHYRAASMEEKLAVYEYLVPLWVGEYEIAEHYAEAVKEFGFEIEEWLVEGQTYTVLRESPDNKRGAGSYVVRNEPAPDKAVLLQAPHAYFDKYTGNIAADIFFTPRENSVIHGLFVSSVHRYELVNGKRKPNKNSQSDICHNPDHLYTVATASILGQSIDTTIVQLHGFINKRAVSDSIVSCGEKVSSPSSTAMAKSLAEAGITVQRYAEETKRLGATKNVQKLLVRGTDIKFVHIEMVKRLRDRLNSEKELREVLYNSIEASLNGPDVIPSAD